MPDEEHVIEYTVHCELWFIVSINDIILEQFLLILQHDDDC